MSEQHELNDFENIALEAAQEDGMHRVTADDVVQYARSQDVEITKNQASVALRKLADLGLLVRAPRRSRGWGRGWEAVCYDLFKPG